MLFTPYSFRFYDLQRLVRQKTQSDIVVSGGSRSVTTEPEDDMGEYKLQVQVLEQKRENKRLNSDLEAAKQECQVQKVLFLNIHREDKLEFRTN